MSIDLKILKKITWSDCIDIAPFNSGATTYINLAPIIIDTASDIILAPMLSEATSDIFHLLRLVRLRQKLL